ncbi:MAG: putative inosine-5-monophosphate dehydrogenase protein [Rhodospirillales bacterium]|jgi:CBS domain-containing protein|nr:putative inosine-5-monophosphate dehydrogenase protein [Rhodospirillales bacterium]
MKVSEVMTRDVCLIRGDQPIREAAQMMSEFDVGALPVFEGDRLIGMITDRDITIRGVAEGVGPDAKVRELMSEQVKYCFEDDNLDQVCENMSDIQMRRLPVMNREKRLVGIVALGDLAAKHAVNEASRALEGISQPGR